MQAVQKPLLAPVEDDQDQEDEAVDGEDDDDDFSDTDYGFIIDANGELKTMMLPEELMNNPPSSIKKILKIQRSFKTMKFKILIKILIKNNSNKEKSYQDEIDDFNILNSQ